MAFLEFYDRCFGSWTYLAVHRTGINAGRFKRSLYLFRTDLDTDDL